MKIAFINGSPKSKDSSSGYIIHELMGLLEQNDNIISEHCFRKPQLSEKEIEPLTECDVLIFVFPLYVDGIPSHLLRCLIQLEKVFSNNSGKDIYVYCAVNCGFYEGHQNKLAIEMMQNWCLKAGLKWGQGVAIGAGGMLPMIKNVPIGQGPKKNLGKAFTKLANNILERKSEESAVVTPNFPRVFYKLGAEMGWRQSIKANGLKKKDLFLRK